MIKKIFLSFVLYLFTQMVFAQHIPVIKINDVEQLLSKQNDTTYIINFWATWCKPCVTELPYFEEINKEYADKKIKVILISLDFKKQLEGVNRFIAERKVKSDVYLLDEINYNSWIDKIDKSWSGAIPITLIINNEKKYRRFYEKDFTAEELKTALADAK